MSITSALARALASPHGPALRWGHQHTSNRSMSIGISTWPRAQVGAPACIQQEHQHVHEHHIRMSMSIGIST